MKKTIIIYFLTLIMVNFFGAISIRNTYLLLLIAPYAFIKFSSFKSFNKYIVILFVSLIINSISCSIFRGQPIILSFQMTAPILFILFVYVLLYYNLKINSIEKVLEHIVILFCIVYIIQYIIYPNIIFSPSMNTRLEEDYDLRIRLEAQGFASIGYFLGLNKYILRKNVFYLALSILCLGIILLMGFRTMIVVLICLTIFQHYKIKGFNIKFIIWTISIAILFFVLIQLPAFSNVLDSMLRRQISGQNFNNEDYIRLIQLRYFTQEHFINSVEYILGSGVPAIGTQNRYALIMERLVDQNINWTDLGLLSLSWVIGIIPVLAMIAYSIKVLFLKVSASYLYIHIWFLYLLLVSFTTSEFYRTGNFVVQAFALYILIKANNNYKLSTGQV